jgi:hypothetical protein
VTVEMHQQNGDRSCKNEAIGGAHYGPVMVYMSKVDDSSKADGSSGWFKGMLSRLENLYVSQTNVDAVYENSWAPASKGAGDNDFWGVKDMNTCCGKVDVKIPADLAAGDYLLRAEVIALHTAGSSGGAQFYMSCCKSIFFSHYLDRVADCRRSIERYWWWHTRAGHSQVPGRMYVTHPYELYLRHVLTLYVYLKTRRAIPA